MDEFEDEQNRLLLSQEQGHFLLLTNGLGPSSYWDWLPDDIRNRIIGMRAKKTQFVRRKPYKGELFSWWLKTVPLEAFRDIEWAALKTKYPRAPDDWIFSLIRKRINFGHRARQLDESFQKRIDRIDDHLSVWYDDAFNKSVHNCVYLFEPYLRYSRTNEDSVCSGGYVDALRDFLPPGIFERFVRVRVLDGFLRNSTDAHARDIALALRDELRPRQVYSLVLKNLHLTHATAEALAEAFLPSMTKMTSLAITHISGGSKPLNRLIRGLIPHGARASGLSRLAVTNNMGRRSTVTQISGLCKASPRLTRLDASGNKLRATDVDRLAVAVLDHTRLQRLNITGNRVTVETVERLQTRCSQRHTALATIDRDADTGLEPGRRGSRIGRPFRRGLQRQLRWADDEHGGTHPLPQVPPRTPSLRQLPEATADPWTEQRSTTPALSDSEWSDASAWVNLIDANTAKGAALRQLRDDSRLTAPAAQQWLTLLQHHQDAHHRCNPAQSPSIHITPPTLLRDLLTADPDRVDSTAVARAYEDTAPTMRAHGLENAELYDMHLILIPIILCDHWSLVTVDMREMRIDYFDPSGGDGTRICEAIRLWLCDMHQRLRTVRAGRPPPPKPRRLPRRAEGLWTHHWPAPGVIRHRDHPHADNPVPEAVAATLEYVLADVVSGTTAPKPEELLVPTLRLPAEATTAGGPATTVTQPGHPRAHGTWTWNCRRIATPTLRDPDSSGDFLCAHIRHIIAGTDQPLLFTQQDSQQARRRRLYELQWQHIADLTPPVPTERTRRPTTPPTDAPRPDGGVEAWTAGQVLAYDATDTGVTAPVTFRGYAFPERHKECVVTMPDGRNGTVPSDRLYVVEPPPAAERLIPSSGGDGMGPDAARRALLDCLDDDSPLETARKAEADLRGLMGNVTALPPGIIICDHIDAQYSTLTRLVREVYDTIVERHEKRQEGRPRTRLKDAPAHWTVSTETEQLMDRQLFQAYLTLLIGVQFSSTRRDCTIP